MNDFNYQNPTRIIFGRDAEAQIGRYTREMGKRTLLHYGEGSIKRTGLYDRVAEALRRDGVDFVELGGVKPNPRYSLVKEGMELCRREGVDNILAVGGGSVIDSAKAIAVGVYHGEDIWGCFIGEKEVRGAIPIGCVLTIPAAGSESSEVSVITNEDGGYKRGMHSHHIYPRFAVINPEVTLTLPPYQVGCGCTDIFAHLMERYFTNVRNVDVSDRMLEGLMRSVIINAPITLANIGDYDSRAEVCWAGTLAHNGLLDCGRVGDWASHQIEHELSAMFDVAHGAGLAIVIPSWMRYVYRDNVDKFVQFAVRVMDVGLAFEDREAIALEGIARLERFFASIGMPTRISQLDGVVCGDGEVREMADKTVRHSGGKRGQFKTLYRDDIEKILRNAL
jgi:hypothetical protein